jgi:hypothetical protein
MESQWELIKAFQTAEIQKGNYLRPAKDLLDSLPYIHLNPQAAIWQKTKYRIITDMKRSNLNSSIHGDIFGYLALDRIAHILDQIRKYDRASNIVIIQEDVTAFYRQFTMRLCDIPLQAIQGENGPILETKASFGAATSPFFTSQTLDLWASIMNKAFDIDLLHYIDNIFTVCHETCSDHLKNIIHKSLAALGLPLNPKDSHCGPLCSILGFLISTASRTISIPEGTKQEILQMIKETIDQRVNQKHLQRIGGKLLPYFALREPFFFTFYLEPF